MRDSTTQQMRRPKFNSAFRLCYSLQLLPCYNEKHQLIAVLPSESQGGQTSCWDDIIAHWQPCDCPSSSSSSDNHYRLIAASWDQIRQRCSKLEIKINCWLGRENSQNSQTIIEKRKKKTKKMSDSAEATRSRRIGGPASAVQAQVKGQQQEDGVKGHGGVESKGQGQGLSVLWVPVVFLLSTLCLYLLSLGIAGLDTGKSFKLKFPTSIEDISEMSEYLARLRDDHLARLLLVFCAGYVYKQTFAIPGSVFLNLLAGALFGPYLGFLLACPLTALGATNCYMLSRTFGRSYVVRYFPDRVKFFQDKMEENKDSLFFFLLFLRLFPMSPNWAMNIVAPLVGIPTHMFFLSVLIGLMPYNFVCVQTGSVLSQISSVSDILTTATMLKMAAVALVALLPGLVIKKLQKK